MRLAQRGPTFFVVWNSQQMDIAEGIIEDMLRKDGMYYSQSRHNIRVTTYGRYMSYRREPGYTCVFDHYVTERLEYERTGKRRQECIRIALECNGWTREVAVNLNVFDSGHYRMAMAEPISLMAYSGVEYDCDVTVTVKVTEFHRTSRYNKDGLCIFENK